MRKIWFWLSLVLSGVIGTFAYDAVPDLISLLTDTPLSPSYMSVLQNSLTVAISGKIALAVIAFALLGLVVPALFEGIALGSAATKIKKFPPEASEKSTMPAIEFESQLGDIRLTEEAIPAYARFLIEQDDPNGHLPTPRKRQSLPRLKALVPSATFFGPRIFVEEHLLGWLFRPLAFWLLGCGLIMFIAACLFGFHDYREALPLDPVAGAGLLWSWVEKGLLSLTFAATGALITLIITRSTLALRTAQVRGFCRFLDAKFAYSPPSAALNDLVSNAERENRKTQEQLQRLSIDITTGFDASQQKLAAQLTKALETLDHKLGQTIELALRQPLEKLTEVSGQVAGKQSEMTAQVIKTALDAFVENLDKELGSQFRKSNALLKSTVLLSAKVEKGFLGTLQNLTKQGAEKNSAVSEVSREINETLGGLKGFGQALEQAVTSIQPTLDRVLENQASLLAALADEKSASKTMQDAATEMGKAAKASKDTIESFITLAEKLKEASRSMSLPAGAVPARATSGDGLATGSTLGRAIRGLQDKAETTGKLPKL